MLRGSFLNLDLIVRRATITETSTDLGITAYLTACGPTADEAIEVLGSALGKFVDTLCARSTLK